MQLGDHFVLDNISKCNDSFLYHNQFKTKKRPKPLQCYKVYKSKQKRFPEQHEEKAPIPKNEDIKDSSTRQRKSSRPRSDSGVTSDEKKSKRDSGSCVICQKVATGSWPNQVYVLYRLSEMKLGDSRAAKFLSAMHFNEDHVHTSLIYCKSIGDIFAADVYYHKKCMDSYLKKYERNVAKVLENIQREDEEIVLDEKVNAIFENIDFEHKAFSLTDITKTINDSLSYEFDNRRTKSYLIKFFGEEILFSYAKERAQAQIVFKQAVAVSDIIEGQLRGHDSVKECARALASEIKELTFNLDESLCTPADLEIAMERFKESRPKKWMKFVSELFAESRHTRGDGWYIKSDAVFQIFYHWLSGRLTPMHCGLTEMIHCISKSREIIDVICRHGLGISYDSMKRIDTGLAMQTIERTGDNRGPVSESIKAGTPIQAAIDNFNHKERTHSGGDVSNDTVLVIWQNQDKDSELSHQKDVISKQTGVKGVEKKRSLNEQLPCQNLIESRLFKKTAEVSDGFTPTTNFVHKESLLERAEEKYFTWFCSRNLQHMDDNNFRSEVPSQTAVNSKLLSAVNTSPTLTSVSFFPILPYPATLMDSIYTSMLNFKDVLQQRDETCGALWCDEGVYCLAKEIQLLKPEQFGTIFIGLGPFHWSKILMGAVGKWLSSSGIGEALINSQVFSAGAAKTSVLQGGDYVKAKEGMNIIAETITLLQYKAFMESDSYQLRKHHDLTLEEVQYDMNSVFTNLYESSDVDTFQNAWEMATLSVQQLRSAFKSFKQSNNGNQNFEFWDIFLDFMYPCIRDFESSVRCGKWELFLSAIERSLVIFFATGRPNYSRYGTLFYQDCLDLQRKFPDIYKHYKDGMFVCYMSERHGSGIGFDQALEKAYNHTAKSTGGIIGMTRRKQAVAMWDLIKHEKDLYVSFVRNTVKDKETMTELDSLHHEFNSKKAAQTHGQVKQLVDYIESVKNPFSSGASSSKLMNLTSLEEVQNVDYLLNCIPFGRTNYSLL